MAGPLGDFAMWLLGGAASVLTAIGVPVGKVIKDNRRRSLSNQRQLEGDPENPNAEGVLEIAHETRRRVEAVETNLEEFRRDDERKHEEVMDRLERLQDTQD